MPTDAPWGQQATNYSAREDRRMLDRLANLQDGVVGDGDLKITPVSGLQVQAAAGEAWVAGTHAGVTRQGFYPVTLNPAVCAADCPTLSAAHATLPRIDQVILRIRDTSPAPGVSGDAENSGKIEVVTGTATAGATLDNRTGAASLPASSLRLADILVPAAFTGPFVQNTHIRDRRPRAFGINFRIADISGDVALTGTWVNVSNSYRFETRAALLELVAWGSAFRATGAAAMLFTRFLFDGAQLGGSSATYQTTHVMDPGGQRTGFMNRALWTPTAGSHTISVQAAETTTDVTFSRITDAPLFFSVRELVGSALDNSGA